MTTGLLVALGGNALIRAGEEGDIPQQLRRARETLEAVVDLVVRHDRCLLVHGNGPQVGNELLRGEIAEAEVPAMTLDVLVADCQGAMGYLIQQVLGNLFVDRGVRREVATIVTQVVVDGQDEAFARPSKPVGRFHDAAEAAERRDRDGWHVTEDAGRGFRRVVPSPLPTAVVELASIAALYRTGTVVIAAGGGGIPVVASKGGRLRGVEAVVDKDHVARLLARALRPELLVMLTAVDAMETGHGTGAARPLAEVGADELARLLDSGEFPEGSMGPKARCVLEHVRAAGPKARALVTSPEALREALAGRAGTWVTA